MMNEQVIARAEAILNRKEIQEGGCCVLALIDAEGYPTAATISPARIDGIRRVYFCTGKGSNWVKRIQGCGRASVCFNSQAEQYNITMVGEVEVLDDPASKAEMWYDGMGAYFKGPQDPEYCVLRFVTRRYSLMLDEHDVGSQARGTL